MEELGAPSIYQLTKFIYLFNNPEENDFNNITNFGIDSGISNVCNEQDVQGS